MPSLREPIDKGLTFARASTLSFIETNLPRIFLICAIPFVLILSVIMPPFQVADELAHIQRADQIRRGKAISNRLGGTIDAGWVTFGQLYQSMWFHPEVKQTAELAREAGAIRWAGPKDHVNFQNTAQYGPALYLPQVTGLVFGRLTGLSLAQTVVVARIINALVSCLIGYFALRICQRGRYLMFATLLLPMTMSEFGSASQDALIISLSLYTIAVASRIVAEAREATVAEFACFALIVTATTMARPSQIALALLAPLFFGLRNVDWKAKAAIASVALIAILVWLRILADLVPPVPDNLSATRQLRLLIEHPLMLPTLILNSFAESGTWLAKTFIGGLGWHDTYLPDWYYCVAAIVLVLAWVAPGNRGALLVPAGLALGTVGALFVITCTALYLSWTPVGKPTINGMQGRYMLPVLPLLAWMIPNYRCVPMLNLARCAVLSIPLVSLIVSVQAVTERYYGSWSAMRGSLRALLLP